MTAKFIQDGESVDYTPGSAVAAGEVVVQNDLVGVAPVPIPANTQGALAVEGVHAFPKATGGGTAIAAGVTCYWHSTVANATSAGGVLIGKAVLAAADADATVRIKLLQ